MDNGNRFRLSIWVPANVDRKIQIWDDQAQPTFLDEHDPKAYEEIYIWQFASDDDPWASFTEQEAANSFQNSFISSFAPSLHPNERKMEVLKRFIEDLGSFLKKNPDKTTWSDTAYSTGFNGEIFDLRTHAALAMVRHLEWVYRIFKDTPGASVVVR